MNLLQKIVEAQIIPGPYLVAVELLPTIRQKVKLKKKLKKRRRYRMVTVRRDRQLHKWAEVKADGSLYRKAYVMVIKKATFKITRMEKIEEQYIG